jgi:hypothetical protein
MFYYFYAGLVGVYMLLHITLIDVPLMPKRLWLFQSVLKGQAPAPIQYRILTYHIGAILQQFGVSFFSTFIILRAIFTFLGLVVFHLYLREWFDFSGAIVGTTFVAALLPFTIAGRDIPGYYMQPADPLNFLLFTLGLLALKRKADAYLFLILFFGMLNRETVILLIPAYVLTNWGKINPLELLFKTIVFSVVAFGIYVGMRAYYAAYYGPREYEAEFWMYRQNIHYWQSFIYPFALFGGLWVLSFADWRNKPTFLVRLLPIVPVFILLHFLIAIPEEVRLFMPLASIILPAGLMSVLGEQPGKM